MEAADLVVFFLLLAASVKSTEAATGMLLKSSRTCTRKAVHTPSQRVRQARVEVSSTRPRAWYVIFYSDRLE